MQHQNAPEDRTLRKTQRVDVTLRDGAFATGFTWSIDEAISIVRTAALAGCEYVEIGYLGGPPEIHGVPFETSTGCVDHKIIECLVEHSGSTRLLAMLHPTTPLSTQALHAAAEAGLSGVRLVYHPSWENALRNYVAQLRDEGLWLSINIALASHYKACELDAAVTACISNNPNALYLADTSAGLLPTDLPNLLCNLLTVHPNIGVHMHDHLGLALANSIVSVNLGATLVDYSIGGLGRGAGNLQAEIWEALLAAQTGDWDSVVALVALKDHLRANRDGLIHRIDWARIVSGALNLKPTEEDALNHTIGHSSSISELAQLETVLTSLQGVTGLRRRCTL